MTLNYYLTTYLFAKLYFSKLRVWSYFSLCVKWAPNLLDRIFFLFVGKILWIGFSFPLFFFVWQYLCIINDVISAHFVYTYALYLVVWISMCSWIKVSVGNFLNFCRWKMGGIFQILWDEKCMSVGFCCEKIGMWPCLLGPPCDIIEGSD